MGKGFGKVLAIGAFWAAGTAALGQEAIVIRPSPAYYQQQGTAAVAAPVAPTQPAPARPVAAQLPAHPRTAQPMAAPAAVPGMGQHRPLAVQPRPVVAQPQAAYPARRVSGPQPVAAPAAVPGMGQHRPLAVQPRPVAAQPQAAAVPARAANAPQQPLPVQPTPMVAQPIPAAVPAQAYPPPMAGQVLAPVQPVAFPVQPGAYDSEPGYGAAPGTWAEAGGMGELSEAEYAEEYEYESGYEWPGISLGPKIGTTGVGGDLTVGLASFLNLRSGANFASFTVKPTLGDVKYDADVDMLSIPLLVDLYPFGGDFRLTGGAYFQPGTEVGLTSTPGGNVQIGNHVYGPDVVGTLTGKAELSSEITPYLGIGFINTVGKEQRLNLSIDLGVIFQSFDVELTSDGAGMKTQLDTFRKDMEKEEKRLQDDFDKLKIFPVVTLGLALRF